MAQARNIMNTARLQVYRKPSRVPSIIPGVASDASIFDCACLEKVAFIIFCRQAAQRGDFLISPLQVEHRLGEKHDQDHVAEHADVDDLEMAGLQFAGAAERHGGDEMTQHAEGQDDLDPQQRGEAAGEGVGERVAESPGHAQARAEQHEDGEGHDAPCAPADGQLDVAHGLSAQGLADAFQDEDFEEHRAHEQDGGEQMQRNE